MPSGSSLPALVFQLADQSLLSPSDLARQVTKGAILSEAGELDGSECIGDDLSLLGIVGGGHSFKNFESAEGLSSSGGLVGEHAPDGSPEDSGGSAVMDESPAGVG